VSSRGKTVKIIKNRKFAVTLAIASAIVATLLCVVRTAAGHKRDIEAMFYGGVYLESGGYTEPGIIEHLNNGANAALGLSVITEKYPELSAKSADARSARQEVLSAPGISQKAAAWRDMSELFLELSDGLGSLSRRGLEVSERDLSAAEDYYLTIAGASQSISGSHYNDKVDEYYSRQSAIARAICVMLRAAEPEKWS